MALGSLRFAGAAFWLFTGQSMTAVSDSTAFALPVVTDEGVRVSEANPRVPMTPANVLKPGVLYRGDNLHILRQMEDESVDLIYLDPPFFSNRTYEVIWGDEAEVRSFDDRWKGGIDVYIDWMEQRLRQMHRVLRPTGSLYLHCDPAASHHLKVA